MDYKGIVLVLFSRLKYVINLRIFILGIGFFYVSKFKIRGNFSIKFVFVIFKKILI